MKCKQYWFQVRQLVTWGFTWIFIVCKILNIAIGVESVSKIWSYSIIDDYMQNSCNYIYLNCKNYLRLLCMELKIHNVSYYILNYSGIFGVFLSLSNIKLAEISIDRADFSKISGVAKVCMISTFTLMNWLMIFVPFPHTTNLQQRTLKRQGKFIEQFL